MKKIARSSILFILIVCIPLLLSACGKSTEEKIFTHLETAVDLEAQFEEQQVHITELEKDEQEIYNEIINLGMDEFEKIKELSDEAIEIIEKRHELIELEQESINNSKEEFMKVRKLIDDLDNQEIKQKVKKMVDIMKKRYKSYAELNVAYKNSLDLERELYELLKKEDVKQYQITEQINKINDSYQIILEKNDQFNAYTVEYNDLKKEFYQLTQLAVIEKEERVNVFI